MTRVTFSQVQIADWLDSGNRLTSGQFTFSIPGSQSIWPGYNPSEEPFQSGYATADAALSVGFVNAIAAWDELIAPEFVRVADNATNRGEVRIAITGIDDDIAGYAYFPNLGGGKAGDIWLNADSLETEWGSGSYGMLTLVHEVGHTLGLDHPFNSEAAPESLDSVRYTVMSYNWVNERYVSFGKEGTQFYAYFSQPVPDSPMVLDIAAVQEKYGADPDTRADDTIYTFGEMSPSLHTIYDAGGIDTIDLTGIAFDNVVDLTPGAYSSIAMATAEQQIAYWSGMFPNYATFIREVYTQYLPEQDRTAYTFADNVAIALSTVIENVLGGGGDDEISGNAADNTLFGNDGDDLLVGLAGSDMLQGGSGNDELYGDGVLVMPDGLATSPGSPPPPPPEPVDPDPSGNGDSDGDGSTGGFRLTINTSSAMHLAPERLELAAAVGLSPDRAALRLSIGEDAPLPAPDPDPDPDPDPTPDPDPPTDLNVYDDMLFGGDGNDLLVGGAGRDFLSGGSGADVFRFAGGDFAGATKELADVIIDFTVSEGDRIDLSAIDALDGLGDDAFRFIGGAAFSGSGAELRTVQYEGFMLLEGDTSGDGLADFAIRLDGLTSLSASSLIV